MQRMTSAAGTVVRADDSSILDRWDVAHAAALSPPELLLYRSNLLGADKRVTNFGGGNTSAKLAMPDPLSGEPVQVLWVKGSGGDLGSMKLDGFATLYQDKLERLIARYTGPAMEDAMVALYPHCTFALNPRAASIDTPLHAFVPRAHVDHTHPDAVIAVAAAADSERLTREIWNGEIGWLAWRRPGFELGLQLQRFAAAHPEAKGVLMAAHGLITWADDPRECYATTLGAINRAQAWLEDHARD
jgi:rhamnose utilization protein RhaD (predicted bifunctional aldolase and dehydrogenase)